MKKPEYKLLADKYNELTDKCDTLACQIKTCNDPEAVKLLRLDYRAFHHEKTVIYEKLIAATTKN
ncbi:hypothetical protein [Pseudopedobacter beijingensis]|uniref:Uncharacterized protein n=1 Tax=Pseudopedobacter beijingensis TaxID=1207056 RepID=A0ABW4IGU9_9SPHI